jgi:4-oxalocrotonate tautomerase
MPLVRILVHPTVAAEARRSIASIVCESMRETIGIPEGDRFILISAHNADWSFGKGQAPHVLNSPAWARKSNEGN